MFFEFNSVAKYIECFSAVQQLLHASCGLPKIASGDGGTGDPARSRAARGAPRAAAGRSRAPPGTAAGGAPGGPRRAGLAAPVRAQERYERFIC